jgi:hypothetical protein
MTSLGSCSTFTDPVVTPLGTSLACGYSQQPIAVMV